MIVMPAKVNTVQPIFCEYCGLLKMLTWEDIQNNDNLILWLLTPADLMLDTWEAFVCVWKSAEQDDEFYTDCPWDKFVNVQGEKLTSFGEFGFWTLLLGE